MVADVVVVVAGLLNRIKRGDNNIKGRRKRFWKKKPWILQMASMVSERIDTYGNSISSVPGR